MIHWTFVTDTFYIKSRGQVVCVADTYELKLRAGWKVHLCGPEGQVFMRTIVGVEEVRNTFDKLTMYGVHLSGFDEKVVMDNWLMAVHER